jgi:NDP-sugar pyrophosphorylase family protein
MKPKQAVVLAGGRGSSFYCWFPSLKQEVYKPMLEIAGKPLVEYIVDSLHAADINEIILAVYHNKDRVKSYFGDGSKLGVSISYLEDEGKGHVQALRMAEPLVDDIFVTCYGDHIFSKELPIKHLSNHEQKGTSVTYYRKNSLWANCFLKTEPNGRITYIEPWNCGTCGPITQRELDCEVRKGAISASKTIHVFNKKIFDSDYWNSRNITGIQAQLAKDGEAYAFPHDEFEAHVHSWWSHLMAIRLLDRKRYEEIRKEAQSTDIFEDMERKLESEFGNLDKS